jgi:hypothetical protein
MTRPDSSPDRTIELSDPRAMRAYAHPVRMALLGLLRTHGPMTATQAAERLGESSGTCSFHFRQLAKYGFCEEAGGGKGREKPWRATATFTTWSSTPADPERAEAEYHLNVVVVQRYFDLIARWLANRGEEPPEWQQAFGFGDLALPMTADELNGLRDEVQALIRPYVARITGEAEAPDDARRVNLVHFAFPEPERQS